MVDTQRSESQLLTALFQDGQAAGSITAQDMRDLIVSLQPSHGAVSVSTPAATGVVSTGSYVKAAGVTTASSMNRFLSTENNRLKYTGTVPSHLFVTASFSVSVAGANQTVGIRLAKNGVSDVTTTVKRELQSPNDFASVSLAAGISVSSSDFIEIFLTNETSTGNVTLDTMYFHAIGHVE